jgi:hypothetical protein
MTTPPRPTAEQLAAYEAQAANQPSYLQGVTIVGTFMSDQLADLPFTEEEVESITFNLGRACLGRDPWVAFDLMWEKRVQADLETKEQRKTWADTPVEQAVPEPSKMLIDYLSQIQGFCGEEGVFPQPMLWNTTDDKLTMEAIAADGNVVCDRAVEAIGTGTVKELVMGMDRSASPGQGLEFNDFITVVWYVGGEFYTAVIDYKPGADEADQVIREPNWHNNWWNHQMQDTLVPRLREALSA